MNFLQKNFKTLREKTGLNQAQLSISLGFSRGVWNGYENGKSTPSLADYFKITKYFGCEGVDLLNEDLLNVHLTNKTEHEKKGQNVHLNVHGNVHLNPKKEGKKVIKSGEQLPANEGGNSDNKGVTLVEAQQETIAALKSLNSILAQKVATLEEENTRLKRDIPQIGSPMADKQSKSA